MNFETRSAVAGLCFAALASGCATTPPVQLVEARDAYATSSRGLAAQLTPTELYDAKKILDQANQTFAVEGDTLEVRDYAYIANRKIQLANAKARTEADRRKIAEAEKQGVVVRDLQAKSTGAALADTRAQLEGERSASAAAAAEQRATNVAQGVELERSAAKLEAEKEARLASDARLAGAMKDLATVAAVKEDARGVVITLSGSVLFASGKATLLETAKTKLDQVAAALKAQAEHRSVVVEGHTDSQGTDASNQPLSLDRAAAVRDYLVSRGVEADRISAVGLGSSRPLLDNRNAENRANNRRVEIVVQASPLTAR